VPPERRLAERGAAAIGNNFVNSAREADYRGTVDELIIDVDRLVAALEGDVQSATWVGGPRS
jgi:hypothetical protein